MRLEKNSETWGEMKQEIAKSDSCEKKTQANQLERAPCPYQPFKIHGLFTLNDVHLMAPPTLFHKSCPLGTREPRPLQPAKLLLWQSACSTSWWSMETKLQQTVTMNRHKQRWLFQQTSPFSDSRPECQVTWDSTGFQLLNLQLICQEFSLVWEKGGNFFKVTLNPNCITKSQVFLIIFEAS